MTVKLSANPERKRRFGCFYTPAPVVEFILDRVGVQVGNLLGARILDPACGHGQFLLPLLRRLVAAGKQTGTPPTAIEKLIRENLWGCDVDGQAVQAAGRLLEQELRSLLSGEETGPNRESKSTGWHLLVQDFLRPAWEGPFGLGTERFDLVVGNPPYGARFSQEDRDYFRSAYRTIGREVNSFGLFIEKSLALLREGGILAFIVPNNLVMAYHYQPLRRYILDQAAILEICDCRDRVFPDTIVDTMIILLRRTTAAGVRRQNRIRHLMVRKNGDCRQVAITRQECSLADPEHRICAHPPLQFNSRYPVVRLGELFRVSRGIEKGIRAAGGTPGPGKVPVLAGRDIERYRIRFAHRYLPYGQERGVYKDEKIFNSPEKLLVRRVGNKLTAAFDDSRYYTLKTVYNLLPRTPGLNLKYYLALLNSRCLDQYAQSRLRSPKRTFAEIHQVQLRQLPLVAAPPAIQDEVAALVDRLLDVNGSPVVSEAERREVEERLEALVADLYGVPVEETFPQPD